MARLARLVIPGLPHHVTQRGNRRQQTFFNDGDYAAYVELMAEWCREEELRDLRDHARTGRPLGTASFLDRLESVVGRVLRPQKGGRPSKLRKIP